MHVYTHACLHSRWDPSKHRHAFPFNAQVNGHFTGDFLVATVGLPPHESRAESIAALAGLDLLHPPLGSSKPGGMGGSVVAKAPPAAVDPMVEQSAMLIVMSDVYLDQATVLEKLADVFAGYEGVGAQMLRCGKELRCDSP